MISVPSVRCTRWLWRAVFFNLGAVSLKLGYRVNRKIIVRAFFFFFGFPCLGTMRSGIFRLLLQRSGVKARKTPVQSSFVAEFVAGMGLRLVWPGVSNFFLASERMYSI